jgi:hypothetical protein
MSNANRILSIIALAADPSAVIAGGYARDLILGRKPKDIDIWLHPSSLCFGWTLPTNQEIADHLVASLEAAGIDAQIGEVKDTCMYDKLIDGGSDRMLRTIGLIKMLIDSMEVDVLLFHEPLDADLSNLLLSFDVGLCRAAIRANGEIVQHASMVDDMAGKTLTVDRPTKHALRLAAKFPDYKLAGPAADLLLAKSETSLVDEAMQLLDDLESHS